MTRVIVYDIGMISYERKV